VTPVDLTTYGYGRDTSPGRATPTDLSAYGYGYDTPPAPSDEVQILDYVRILYKRRWTALTILILVVAATSVYTLTRVPVYEARVQLLIDPEPRKMASLRDILEEQENYGYESAVYYQTQYKVLQSRALARRALDKLGTWDSPAFSGAPTPRFSIGRTISATVEWASTLVRETDVKQAPLPAETARQSAAIDAFLRHLTVSPVRESRLVEIRFVSADRALAARAANAHAEAYIEQNLEFRFTASQAAARWLDDQLAEQRRKVEASELALQSYRERGDAVALEDRQNIVVQRFAELSGAETRARTERIDRETQYKRLVALQEDGLAIDTFPAIVSNTFIQQLKGELADLQRERAKLSETYGEKHNRMVEIRSAIQAAEIRLQAEIAKIVESVRNEFLAAEAQEQSLTAALARQKAEVLALNRSAITYGVLRREAEGNQQVYDILTERAKETGVSSELRVSNIHIVDAAEVPRSPSSPNRKNTLLLGFLAGCALAAGAVFFFDFLDRRITSPDEIKTLGLLYLGLVPKVDVEDLPHRAPLLGNGVPAGFAEALRLLRTNVRFSVLDATARSLAVTSATPGEGKTQVAGNLAIGFAQAGQRVLLVDADLRRACLHQLLDLGRSPGLSEVITGQAKTSESVVATYIPNLWLMPAGTCPPNPAELLGSDRVKELFARLTDHFDWVIVDTPPVVAVADASLLAHLVGGVVFVVGSEMTDRHMAEQALEQLASVRARVVGGVLNRVDVDRHRYYYRRYYRHEYADYYDRGRYVRQ